MTNNDAKKYLYAGLLTTAIVIGIIYLISNDSNVPAELRSVAVDPPYSISSFNLVDHEHNTVDIQRLKNNWSFIFFGYTHCPDVCPATMSQLSVINKSILMSQKEHAKTQFIFVSVDPQRDTIDHLAKYINYFDPEFIAMTGEEENIAATEAQVGAFHRFDSKSKSGHYTVQHSAEVFLVDPSGRLTAKFVPPMDPVLVSKQFLHFVRLYAQQTT